MHALSISSAVRIGDLQTCNEDIWLEIQLKAVKVSLIIGTIYRPPSQSASELAEFLQNFEQSVQIMSSRFPRHISSQGISTPSAMTGMRETPQTSAVKALCTSLTRITWSKK